MEKLIIVNIAESPKQKKEKELFAGLINQVNTCLIEATGSNYVTPVTKSMTTKEAVLNRGMLVKKAFRSGIISQGLILAFLGTRGGNLPKNKKNALRKAIARLDKKLASIPPEIFYLLEHKLITL